MKRKIYEKLLEWKKTSNGRSAVLIDGARRIGKSWIAEEFARNEYPAYLLIDFICFHILSILNLKFFVTKLMSKIIICFCHEKSSITVMIVVGIVNFLCFCAL